MAGKGGPAARTAGLCRLLTTLATLAFGISLNAAAATPFNGVDISHTKSYAQDFRLTDHEGRTRTLADFRGKAVVLFFGYLQCPNFCRLPSRNT